MNAPEGSSGSTLIPAQWAMLGLAVPAVCVRHGRPQARRVMITISERTPGWTQVVQLLAGHLSFIVAATSTKSIEARWPFCDRCLERHHVGFVNGVSAIVAGGVVIVAAVILNVPLLIVAGIGLAAAAGEIFSLSSWSWLSRARLHDNASWVEVPEPSAEFVAEFEVLRTEAGISPAQAAAAAPVRITKNINGFWYLALVGGICLAIFGAFSYFSSPMCGIETMRPGDVCQGTSSNGGEHTTYEHEREVANYLAIAGVVGGVVAFRAGIRIGRWNGQLRRAYAARAAGG